MSVLSFISRLIVTVLTALGLTAAVTTTMPAATALTTPDGGTGAATGADTVEITAWDLYTTLGAPTTTIDGTDAWTIDRRVFDALRDNPLMSEIEATALTAAIRDIAPDITDPSLVDDGRHGAGVIDITTDDLTWLFGPNNTALGDEGALTPAWTVSRAAYNLLSVNDVIVPRNSAPAPSVQAFRPGLEQYLTMVRLDPTINSTAVGMTTISCNVFADGVPTYVDVPGGETTGAANQDTGRWYRIPEAGGWVKNWGWCI